MAGPTKNKVSVRCSMQRVNFDSVSWVQGFLLSFRQKGFIMYTYTNGPIIASAQAQSNVKKQAPQQPQLGAWRFLKMNTKKRWDSNVGIGKAETGFNTWVRPQHPQGRHDLLSSLGQALCCFGRSEESRAKWVLSCAEVVNEVLCAPCMFLLGCAYYYYYCRRLNVRCQKPRVEFCQSHVCAT